jgi:O-antigen ligase
MKGAPVPSGLYPALLSWMIAVAAAWLAVGSQPWRQTVLIAALGALYLLFPPAGSFPRPLFLLSCLLLALAATAFLPAAWLGASFRKPFQDQGIVLPWTYSPQPWLSFEDLTLLAAGLLWTWNCFETKLSLEHRQFLISRYLLALGFVALATIFYRLSMSENLPALLQGVGQFMNRNLTGDILVMGGICSLAHGRSKIIKNKSAGVFWMIMTLVFLTAIILNGSRAALVLFGAGLLVFFALGIKDPHHRTITAVLIVVVLMVGALIFVSQGTELQGRFDTWMAGGKEGRIAIYQDAAAMVRLSPWFGFGLGNFEGVFNTLRVHSADQLARALHPESDWWWFAADMGIGGVLTLGLLVTIGFQTYLRKIPFPSLTNASITVAALFLIHSLFDISGHVMGTAWSCLYLVGLGASRPFDPRDVKLPKIFLRLAGLLLLTLALLRVQSISLNPWMPTWGSLTKVEEGMPQHLSDAERKSILDRALSWAPLDWDLYFRRASIGLDHPEINSHSEADFNRVLYLEQSTVEIPTYIGNLCVQRDFPEAMRAWRQLLQRQRAAYAREGFFESIPYQNLNEEQRDEITTLAGDDPQLQALAIVYQNTSDFERYLRKLLDKNPSLQGVSKPTLRRLLDRWGDVGDVDQFIKEWSLHPEWQEPGWRAYARALAKTGHERDAVTTALRFMSAPNIPNPPAPQDLDNAADQFRANPQDAYSGILLYSAQKSKGLNAQALDTLLTLAKLPKRPSYIPYLLAKDLLQADQDKAAWQVLAPVLNDQ